MLFPENSLPVEIFSSVWSKLVLQQSKSEENMGKQEYIDGNQSKIWVKFYFPLYYKLLVMANYFFLIKLYFRVTFVTQNMYSCRVCVKLHV